MIFGLPLGCADQAQRAGPADTELAKTTPAPSEYPVGEPAKLDDVTLTVNTVERNYTPNNAPSLSPRPGNEFIRVNVTLSNEGKSRADYNEFYYKVRDSRGVERGVSLVPGVSQGLTLGTIAPGETVTGNMVFEVPQGDNGLKLIVGNGDVIVKL